MIHIDKHLPAPHGIAPVLVRNAPKLVLPFGERSKSRLRAVLDNGNEAAVFLPRGTVVGVAKYALVKAHKFVRNLLVKPVALAGRNAVAPVPDPKNPDKNYDVSTVEKSHRAA